jgi:CHAT domain-containing protein
LVSYNKCRPEGLSGLAKAFFYAGARSLLVSHWPVDSVATVKLTTGAFRALESAPAIGRAEAFRRAMLAMIDDAGKSGNPAYQAHPVYWAPFVVGGEGGSGK